jgi:hypothetical protein
MSSQDKYLENKYHFYAYSIYLAIFSDTLKSYFCNIHNIAYCGVIQPFKRF